MSLDICGGLFSLLSLLFKAQFDWLAAVSYIAVIVSHPNQKYHWRGAEIL
jgi:hypothetical protein